MSKRYYWLKLHDTFFQSDDIKIIRKKENGPEYIMFWQQLLLKAIKQEEVGLLRYKEKVPYSPEIFAAIFDMNIDIVKGALTLFLKLDMIEIWDDETIFIKGIENLVGSETDKARIMRKIRSAKKDKKVTMLPSVTDSYTEKELDLKKETDIGVKRDSKKLLEYLNDKANRKFKVVHTYTINALKTYSIENLKKIVDIKVKEWSNDNKMKKCLI